MKLEEMISFVDNCCKIIKEKNMKEGHFDCPDCGKKVHFSVADNGHTRGACETPKCISWIE